MRRGAPPIIATAALLSGVLLALPACRRAPAALASVATPRSATGRDASPPPPAPARVESAGYPFTPAESLAVEEFLRRHPELRIASDADRLSPEEDDVRSLYGVYHAYFVRGDINDDGILDFVLAFVRRDSSRETPFSIVVFAGKEQRGSGPAFASGTFLEKDISLAHGDVSIDRDAVLITPDLSDEAVRRYRWDPVRRSYVFVRDDGDEDPTPPLART